MERRRSVRWFLTRGCAPVVASLVAGGAFGLAAASLWGENGIDVGADAETPAPDRPRPESLLPGVGSLDRRAIEVLADRAAAVTIPIAAAGCARTIAGNAVYVDELMLTNRHLVERAASVRTGSTVVEPLVADGDRDERTASVDLGLVHPPSPQSAMELTIGPSAPLATQDPAPGEAVLLAGWIDGRFHTMVGRVHAYTTGGAHGDGVAMLIEPATEPGFSGGPVLDRHGEVVGILRAVDATTELAVAVPASDIREWRRLAMRRVEPPTCP